MTGAHRVPGAWIVITLLAATLLTGALTWRNYHLENPTSISGRITRTSAGWAATAAFAPRDKSRVVAGLPVVITSPAFPGRRMTGLIRSAGAGGVAEITFVHGPPAGAGISEAGCVVSVAP
jgi:hypothetical protein